MRPTPRSYPLGVQAPPRRIGPFPLQRVVEGDCTDLAQRLPAESVDVLVTSPPYWGQRRTVGLGGEPDPREYVRALRGVFELLRAALKPEGLIWINVGDAYNTPVNWRLGDRVYSTLGPDRGGLAPGNAAYVKPRHPRRAFIDPETPWLRYGNLLGLPHRLAIALMDGGLVFRGEVIWRKRNPMPEGRCRRPHRQHETIYLFARSDGHRFRTSPPVGSVWDFAPERVDGLRHYSRFPEELPRRCIEAYGELSPDTVVLDPFAGSGTTGVAALRLGCSFLGFEIDPAQAAAANRRLAEVRAG
jgi:DNA modification methylase